MKLKKHIGKSALALALAVSAGTCAQARDLTLVSWGGAYQDAQREAYFAPFATEKGTKVLEANYTGGLAQVKSMVDSNNIIWDAILLERNDVIMGCDEGLLEELPASEIIGDNKLVDGSIHTCAIGNVVTSVGFIYNAEKAGEKQPKTWADFWDTKTWPGKRGLRTGPKLNLEAALLADGVARSDVYVQLKTPEGVDRAFKKLDEIKPDLQFWDAGAQPAEWLVAGDVVMSSQGNGRAALAQRDAPQIRFVWRDSLYEIDSWSIIRGSPNAEAAKEFIRFASTAEPQAAFSKLFPYGPTNVAAAGLVDSAVAEMLPAGANMDEALGIDQEFWAENFPQISQRWNEWVAK